MPEGTYRNPVLNADWSDPDVIRVGDDFYLTASSFSKVPGLPILHSRDLVNWSIVGHALDELEGLTKPEPGCRVWAPSLRHHDGRFWIFYGDPDRGIHVLTATDPRGPWSRPHLIKPGQGLIDPCPFWDDDGAAYLVHGWAKSRSGVNNRLTLHRMDPDARRLLDAGQVVIDGDLLPGYRTLEGPKLYKRDGDYWIFAPAGGVTDGWQSAFRAKDIAGPYTDRIVLEQGDTDVNGPHQGAWVDAPDGSHWFLHFQDRGPFGRVVHLQPLRWSEDGWPIVGDAGRPVPGSRMPVPGQPAAAPASGDAFASGKLGAQWHWPVNPGPAWWKVEDGTLNLACLPGPDDLRERGNVVGQRLPGGRFTARTSLTLDAAPGSRAGLAILGHAYAWLGVELTAEGPVLACRTADAGQTERDLVAPMPLRQPKAELTVEVDDDGRCLLTTGGVFNAVPGRWVGAVIGLFAAGGAGRAGFQRFDIDPGGRQDS
ncbi:glycoside hydrolase family 43 protein [Nonomuraea diastatica]|uniref:Glycosyl hydrolase 43 family protein n=1 Tax=Nonomuraea diastatica TaxID=1848329 RepID=A0A4R4W6K0_9ACTN|nr:glycoside hydrolase 43 family protein [Nonomuraea diastatica]TDD14242.1 glycosyl hydrolase 43 family protein [Nonomuraea diastatica]